MLITPAWAQTGLGGGSDMLMSLLPFVLIFVINKQSFGWTIQFHWPVAVLIGALSLVFLTTIAAALYPARVAEVVVLPVAAGVSRL